MAATNIDLLAYSDALLVLGTAGVIVPAVHRWRVNPVLAFLVAGAVLGPLGSAPSRRLAEPAMGHHHGRQERGRPSPSWAWCSCCS